MRTVDALRHLKRILVAAELVGSVVFAARSSDKPRIDEMLAALEPVFRSGIWSREDHGPCSFCGVFAQAVSVAYFAGRIGVCADCVEDAKATFQRRGA